MRKWLFLLLVCLAAHAGSAGEVSRYVWSPLAESSVRTFAACDTAGSNGEVRNDRRQLVEMLTETTSNPAYSEPSSPLSCHLQRLSEVSSEYPAWRYADAAVNGARIAARKARHFSTALMLRAAQPVERYVLRLRRLLI